MTITLGTDYVGVINSATNYYKFVIATAGTYTLTLSNVTAGLNLSSVVSADADFLMVEGFGVGTGALAKTHDFATAGTYYMTFDNLSSGAGSFTFKIQP